LADSLTPDHAPFRNSPFGLVLTDAEGMVLSVNDRAAELLAIGMRAGHAGMTCCELICGPLNGSRAAGASRGA
jgi:hypothetical protein